jgi:hypothetical protein
MNKVRRRIIAATLIKALALFMGAGGATAWADTDRSTIPKGRGYGVMNDAHTRIRACDLKEDGWGVRVHYGDIDAAGERKGLVGDANGAKGDKRICGEEGPDYGGRVLWIQACAGPNGEDRECGPRLWFGGR